MKITDIQVSTHVVPCEPPYPAAWDSIPRATLPTTIVRVQTDTGLEGFASGDPCYGIEDYKKYFIGQDPRDMDRHTAIIDNIGAHHCRMWPLDNALWDLNGKIEGEPVWKLLGGTSPDVPLYASTGSLRDPAVLAGMAREYQAQGYEALKLRFGRASEDTDIEALARVREAVGPDMAIMVDVNHGWRMPWDTHPGPGLEEIMALEERTREHDLFWLEEPLHRGDYVGMKALRETARCRIAGGEITREMHEWDQIMRDDCLDVYQPDVVFVGGLKQLLKLGLQAFEMGRWFTPHTWGNGLGIIVNAHLVAAIAGHRGKPPVWLEFAHDPPEFTESPRDMLLMENLRAEEGWLRLSNGPGWGVELNEVYLASVRV